MKTAMPRKTAPYKTMPRTRKNGDSSQTESTAAGVNAAEMPTVFALSSTSGALTKPLQALGRSLPTAKNPNEDPRLWLSIARSNLDNATKHGAGVVVALLANATDKSGVPCVMIKLTNVYKCECGELNVVGEACQSCKWSATK